MEASLMDTEQLDLELVTEPVLVTLRTFGPMVQLLLENLGGHLLMRLEFKPRIDNTIGN